MCLQVQSFHFFVSRSDVNNRNLAELYTLACALIENAMELDRTQNFSESATNFVSKLLHLAACTILRISRCHLSQSLDLTRGQRLYFFVILFHRKMSLQNDDTASRSTVILTQLWTSAKAFKRSDGSIDSLSLRCRSRLAMSVVFDCYWWWRQEFAGQPNPYSEKEDVNGIVRIIP